MDHGLACESGLYNEAEKCKEEVEFPKHDRSFFGNLCMEGVVTSAQTCVLFENFQQLILSVYLVFFPTKRVLFPENELLVDPCCIKFVERGRTLHINLCL